jgi:hypothetical protein
LRAAVSRLSHSSCGKLLRAIIIIARGERTYQQ